MGTFYGGISPAVLRQRDVSVNRPRALSLGVGIFVLLSVSLITSLFLKNSWLWMDEVLSDILIADPSIAHMNKAVVSGMDANPPLFANLYWLIGHSISLNTQFLRVVSILIFSLTIALFFYYSTKLIGTPIQNFVLVTCMVSLTFLNLSLATQIRAYALFLLIGCGYFITIHQLSITPNRPKLLVAHVLLGVGLLFAHNFGLFYLAASGAFFALLWLWSKERKYLLVIGTHGLILLVWLVSWYPSFAIQSQAGKPHSWIPLPTFLSFFNTVGEIAPNLSSKLDYNPFLLWLPIARFVVIAGLFLYIVLKKTKAPFREVIRDKAFVFYGLSGFIYLLTIGIALTVSLVHTSIFLSRYLWPSSLLVIYQLIYAYYYFFGYRTYNRLSSGLLWVYVLFVGTFIVYQNRKLPHFSGDILPYFEGLDKSYPIFVETADYFLPIWFHKLAPRVCYLLDWQTAVTPGNYLNATVEHKILKSVRDNYQVNDIVPKASFNKTNFPHFYIVDEDSQYQIEEFIKQGQVKVVKTIPVAIQGHRILECTF